MSQPRDFGPRKGNTLVRGPRTAEPTIPEPPPRAATSSNPSYTPAAPPGVRVSLPGTSSSSSAAVPPRPRAGVPASSPASMSSSQHDAELMAGVGQTVYEFRGDAASQAAASRVRSAGGTNETFYSEASFSAEGDDRRESNLGGSRMTWVIAAIVVVVAGGLAVGMSMFAPSAGAETDGAATAIPTPAPPGVSGPAQDPGPGDAAPKAMPPGTPTAGTAGGTPPKDGSAGGSPSGASGAGAADKRLDEPSSAGKANQPGAKTASPSGADKPSAGESANDGKKKPSKAKPKKAKPKKKKKKSSSGSSSGIKPKKPPRKDLDDLPPPPDGG